MRWNWRRLTGAVVLTLVSAGAIVLTSSALAQPPGDKDKGFGKEKGFEKAKGFDKDKRDRFEPKREQPDRGDGQPKEMIQRLERELDELRARQAEIENRLRQLRDPERRPMGPPMGWMGPMMGPFGGGFGPGGRFGGPFGGGFAPGGGFGEARFPPLAEMRFQEMRPDQIKELMNQLARILEEKTRGDRGPEKRGPAPDEILKRLDQLSREVDELRRAIKK
jgi:hypothetical protein